VITLPDDTNWLMLGVVDITPNRLELGSGTSVLGTVPGSSTLLTNNAGPALSANANVGGRAVEDVTITNLGGPAMDFTGGVLSNLLIDTVIAENCAGDALNVADVPGLFIRSMLVDGCTNGVIVGGTNGFLRIEDVASASHPAGFTGVNLLAGLIASEIRIQGCTFLLNNASDVGLQLDAAGVDRALVDANQFPGGAGTPLAGAITPATARWLFASNQGIRDSTVSGDLRFVDPAGAGTVVPIAVIGEWADTSVLPYAIAGTPERMSLVGTDILQYDGIDPTNLRITAQVSAEHAGGGNDRFDITVQRDGSPAVGSTTTDPYETRGELNAGEANQIQTTLSLTNVQPGAQFRILIRNRTAVANAEVFSAAITISED
jgi:hypothetical protein